MHISQSNHDNLEQAKILFFSGLECYKKELFVEAELNFIKSLSLAPNRLSALTNLIAVQIKLNKLESANNLINSALSLYPNDDQLYLNQGQLHELNDNWKNALVSYDKALLLNPESPEVHFNRGNALKQLNEFNKAILSYEKAIDCRPDYMEAYSNIGFIMKILKRFDEALNNYDKIIELYPDNAEAYSNRGNVFRDLNLFDKALDSYDMAISINNDYAEAHYNRGITLLDLKQYEEAFQSLNSAIILNKEIDYLLGYHQLTKLYLNDWSNLSSNLSIIKANISANKDVIPPFAHLLFFDDPELQLQNSKIFVKHKWPLKRNNNEMQISHNKDKLRIGYFSADLNYHPVCTWLAEQIENHDKSKFELYAFSLKSNIEDPMRARLRASFDFFIDVEGLSDFEVAKLSRELCIDIALDLGGYTGDSRPGIFACRAAPIQVNHLGFPGTMGSEYIDYLITDIHTIPESSKRFYTEKIVYVPCGYTYDSKRIISNKSINRLQFGLPENGFVFTCQNGNHKIQPEVFEIWMDILQSVPNSVLWLLKPNNTALINLRNEAEKHGIDCDRLIFTERKSVSRDKEDERIGLYLASYNLADLFLDTWPYNAGTTAVDALWSGLPVLTKIGDSAVSRMAASALYAIEVPELITFTSIEYRDLAIELASDLKKNEIIANKIKKNKLTSTLFNSKNNIKYYESAYRKMFERFCNKLPPEHIYINSQTT